MGHDVRRHRDLEAVSTAAAEELAQYVPQVVAEKGRFAIALSGGSTPKRLFEILAKMGKSALPWDRIDVFWGDERTVPPDHADSNYRMTKEALIDPLRLDPNRIHRIRGEEKDPENAVKAYVEELKPLTPEGGVFPVFDYVMLGMGSDGHCASLFPNSPALDEVTRWFVANPVDSPLTKGKTIRLTMTAAVLNWGTRIRFLVCGADKAPALREVLGGPPNPRVYPSQLIQPKAGTLAWLVDDAAWGEAARGASAS